VVQQLLQSTANGNRIAKEIQTFAHRSTVSVDPQYGRWKNQGVVAPVAPPARYLLSAVSGNTQSPLPTKKPSGSSGSTTTTTTIPATTTTTNAAAAAAAAQAAANAAAAATSTTTTTTTSVGG
jgi:hypothetical protein